MHQPLPDSTHKKCDKLSRQNVTTNCDNKLLQQIRAKEAAFMFFIISLMTYETYFPDAAMKFVTLLSHKFM